MSIVLTYFVYQDKQRTNLYATLRNFINKITTSYQPKMCFLASIYILSTYIQFYNCSKCKSCHFIYIFIHV